MYGGASTTLPLGVWSTSASRETFGPEVDAVRLGLHLARG